MLQSSLLISQPSQIADETCAAGWLSSLSWLVGVASAMFIAGNLIPTLISMQDSSFVPKAWHGYLFVVAICIFCVSLKTPSTFCSLRGQASD